MLNIELKSSKGSYFLDVQENAFLVTITQYVAYTEANKEYFLGNKDKEVKTTDEVLEYASFLQDKISAYTGVEKATLMQYSDISTLLKLDAIINNILLEVGELGKMYIGFGQFEHNEIKYKIRCATDGSDILHMTTQEVIEIQDVKRLTRIALTEGTKIRSNMY
jgi:hypothetical protein